MSASERSYFGASSAGSKPAFIVQSIVLIIIILVSAINISLRNGPEQVWVILLGTSMGVILPSPAVKSWLPLKDGL